MRRITILGCGWLGLPLAKLLMEKGNEVKGSTTSTGKIQRLKNAGILPYQIVLSEDTIQGEITNFLENTDILIIDIPPKLRGDQPENFVSKIQLLIPFIEKSRIKKVLFVSSTSVYADNNVIVDENTNQFSDAVNARQLLEAEHLLQTNSSFQTTIVRFGGLIGEDRNPIRFLSGRKGIENPEAPINFIHQNDCIAILNKIIETECWNETFNAVAPQHPTRKEYYTQKAREFDLPLPEFNENNTSVGKKVSSEKLQRILEYTFQNSL